MNINHGVSRVLNLNQASSPLVFAGAVLRIGWFYCGSIPHVGCKPTPW